MVLLVIFWEALCLSAGNPQRFPSFKSETHLSINGANMKKNIISGSVVVVLGLLIALGPQFLFRVCPPIISPEVPAAGCGGCGCSGDGGFAVYYPICHWAARALLGMGMLIAALGIICLLVQSDQKTRLGLFAGVFLSSIIALGIPNALIGGCGVETMACRRIAFPTVSIISIVLLVYSAVIIVVYNKNESTSDPVP